MLRMRLYTARIFSYVLHTAAGHQFPLCHRISVLIRGRDDARGADAATV